MLNDEGLLVVGIDSASLDLILRFRSFLPTLSNLMKGGYGNLESTIPPLSPPAWAAIMTGKNPGKTGIFNWATFHKDTKKVRILSFLDMTEPTIWDILTEKGLKSCIVNVPMTYPAKPLNGILVSGVPGHISDTNITYPRSMKKELDNAVGGYEILPLVDLRVENKEEEYREEFSRILKKRLEAILYLLNKDVWDLFMCVFFVLDSVQHYFWYQMDESYSVADKGRSRAFRDTILDFYKLIDNAIGAIIRENGGVKNLIVCSDHGMGPLYSHLMINNLLMKEGLLQLRRSSTAYTSRLTVKQAVIEVALNMRSIHPRMFDKMARTLPANLIELFSTRQWGKIVGSHLIKNIDLKKSVGYAIGEMGPIFINESINHKEAFIKIAKALSGHLDSRKKETLRIFQKEEIYRGKYTDRAPDLFVLLDDNRFNVRTEITNRNEIWMRTGWTGATGHHSMNGVLIVNSPHIVDSAGCAEGIPRFSIYQVMPTALDLLKIAPPKDIDGVSLRTARRKQRMTT